MICPHCGKETDPAPVVEKQPEMYNNLYACLNVPAFIDMDCDECNFSLRCAYVDKGNYDKLKNLHVTGHRKAQEKRKGTPEGDSASGEN